MIRIFLLQNLNQLFSIRILHYLIPRFFIFVLTGQRTIEIVIHQSTYHLTRVYILKICMLLHSFLVIHLQPCFGLEKPLHLSQFTNLRISLVKVDMCIFMSSNTLRTQNLQTSFIGTEEFIFRVGMFKALIAYLLGMSFSTATHQSYPIKIYTTITSKIKFCQCSDSQSAYYLPLTL